MLTLVRTKCPVLFMTGLMSLLLAVACLPEGYDATKAAEDATKEIERNIENQTKEAEKALDEKRKEFDDLPDCGGAREDVYVVSAKNPGETGGSPIRKIENYTTLNVVVMEDWAKIECTGEAELRNGRYLGEINYWAKKYKRDRKGTREAGFYY